MDAASSSGGMTFKEMPLDELMDGTDIERRLDCRDCDLSVGSNGEVNIRVLPSGPMSDLPNRWLFPL